MRIGTLMPPFDGATEWVNGLPSSSSPKSQPGLTLIHFWSLSCGTCKENLPRVAQWREAYRDRGLRVVAIHMPRYPADMDLDAVRRAIAGAGITEPCAIDNEHKLRDGFLNEQGYVPAYYLFHADNQLRAFAAGERGLDVIAPSLNRLLGALQATAV